VARSRWGLARRPEAKRRPTAKTKQAKDAGSPSANPAARPRATEDAA
jgi:hypothetical protein